MCPAIFLENMIRIKFEIEEPGPIAIKVVDVMGMTMSKFLNSYDSPGEYEFEYNEETLLNGGNYYYRIYDATGLDINDIEGLNGGDRLLQSGNLKLGTNGNNHL